MSSSPYAPDDFALFARTYFQRCKAEFPQLEAVAAKWQPEDLIPRYSDIDLRFVVANDTATADWCRLADIVGRVHLQLARECPHWWRNLEHTPGLNLRWDELANPKLFQPEFTQWTFYDGNAQKYKQAMGSVVLHDWCASDEAFHWRKLAAYYGPYDRTIDPAVNLGAAAPSYPLHSRVMHYFAPAMHAAVCLASKSMVKGKLEALRIARELFPDSPFIDQILAMIERRYDNIAVFADYDTLDCELFQYLQGAVGTLLESYPQLPCPRPPTPAQLCEAVMSLPDEQAHARVFVMARFARLLKARLWFYIQDVPGFDSEPLLRNEFKRMAELYFARPLCTLYGLYLGRAQSWQRDATELHDSEIREKELNIYIRFGKLTSPDCPDGALESQAVRLVEMCDEFLEVLELTIRLSEGILRETMP